MYNLCADAVTSHDILNAFSKLDLTLNEKKARLRLCGLAAIYCAIKSILR